MTRNTCPTEQELTLFVFDDLELEQKRSTAAHLASCPHCRQALAAIQQVTTRLPRTSLRLSDIEKQKFADRVIAATQKQPLLRNLQAWGAAATAVAAGVIAFVIFNPATPVHEPPPSPRPQFAELDLVENMEMLEDMELLEMMEELELLQGQG